MSSESKNRAFGFHADSLALKIEDTDAELTERLILYSVSESDIWARNCNSPADVLRWGLLLPEYEYMSI